MEIYQIIFRKQLLQCLQLPNISGIFNYAKNMENQPLQAVWRIKCVKRESEPTHGRELHPSEFFLNIYTYPTNWEAEKFQICFAVGIVNLQVSPSFLKKCHI